MRLRGPPVGLHRTQQKFLASNALISGFVGGRGAGKTWITGYKMMRQVKAGRLYLSVSPTLPLMRKTTWRSDMMSFQQFHRLRDVNKSDSTLTIATEDGGLAEIWYRSAEDPDTLRGPNLSGARLDEASVMQKGVFDVVLPALREGGEPGWLDLGFTPKGRHHWTFSTFYQTDEGGEALRDAKGNWIPMPNTCLVHCPSRDNPFLDEGFEERISTRFSSYLRRQELEGLFIDSEGLMFLREWFEIVGKDAVPAKAERVRYWDNAATEGGGDYSAGVLIAMADGVFYVEHVIRGQWSPKVRNDIRKQVAQMDAARSRNAVKIWIEEEPGSAGKEAAWLQVQQLAGFPVFTERVSGQRRRIEDKIELPGQGKVVRAQPLAAQAEAGNVKLVSGTWNGAFLDEITAFPESTHDDQVDAAAGAFNKLAPYGPRQSERFGPMGLLVKGDAPKGVQFDRRAGRMIFGRG